jgi:hypothetical protein
VPALYYAAGRIIKLPGDGNAARPLEISRPARPCGYLADSLLGLRLVLEWHGFCVLELRSQARAPAMELLLAASLDEVAVSRIG